MTPPDSLPHATSGYMQVVESVPQLQLVHVHSPAGISTEKVPCYRAAPSLEAEMVFIDPPFLPDPNLKVPMPTPAVLVGREARIDHRRQPPGLMPCPEISPHETPQNSLEKWLETVLQMYPPSFPTLEAMHRLPGNAVPVPTSVYRPELSACDLPIPQSESLGRGMHAPSVWFPPMDGVSAHGTPARTTTSTSIHVPANDSVKGLSDADLPETPPIFEDFMLDSIMKQPPAYHLGQIVETFEVDEDDMVDKEVTVIAVIVGVIYDGVSYLYELAIYNEETGELEIQMDTDFDEEELTAVGPTVQARFISHQKNLRRKATLRLV